MPIPGYTDYKRREYCNSIKCPVQMLMNKAKEGTEDHEKLKEVCREKCLHTAREFHHWLADEGFLIIKPEK